MDIKMRGTEVTTKATKRELKSLNDAIGVLRMLVMCKGIDPPAYESLTAIRNAFDDDGKYVFTFDDSNQEVRWMSSDRTGLYPTDSDTEDNEPFDDESGEFEDAEDDNESEDAKDEESGETNSRQPKENIILDRLKKGKTSAKKAKAKPVAG